MVRRAKVPLELPTRERLHELFEDGGDTLIRRTHHHNAPKGSRVTGQNSAGYYRVGVDMKRYLVHRLLTHMRGIEIPEGMVIDHINGNTLDNTKDNLRVVTRSQNQHNRKAMSNNTSGKAGVYFNKAAGKWQVQVNLEGKNHYGGLHINYLDACKASDSLRAELHGSIGG